MTLFEFLMALAAVVIAIGLSEIFGGWGHMLRTRIVPKIDWLHLCWSVVVSLYAIQYWVGIWPYRVVEFTTIFQVWFLIFPTLFIVLVSFAITPDIEPVEKQDLREYYMARRAPIFLGLTVFVTMAQVADLVILGTSFSWIGMSLVAVLAIPAFTTNVWVHSIVLIFNSYFLVNNAIAPSIIGT
ncbi:MAG: hypothetical protein AB8B95_03715 [Pseudohongiellaceae bacterium]